MDAETLKPCPFCGGEADIDTPTFPMAADCDDIVIRCKECDATGKPVLFDQDTHNADDLDALVAEAIAAWNTRPASPSDVVGNEVLVKAAQSLIHQAFDYYTARNGRRMSIEGDDGEKCWIVPFDAFEELRRATLKQLAVACSCGELEYPTCAIHGRPASPSDVVGVPREPTEAMIAQLQRHALRMMKASAIREAWSAMIAAALSAHQDARS